MMEIHRIGEQAHLDGPREEFLDAQRVLEEDGMERVTSSRLRYPPS